MSTEKQCDNVPVYRATWPGQDEMYYCGVCGLKAINIANAMGFRLRLIPLNLQEILDGHCSQIVKEDEDG